MTVQLNTIDRRRFLRGTGLALTLPWLECSLAAASVGDSLSRPKRLACFYQPDGVPMPLPQDPARRRLLAKITPTESRKKAMENNPIASINSMSKSTKSSRVFPIYYLYSNMIF